MPLNFNKIFESDSFLNEEIQSVFPFNDFLTNDVFESMLTA